MVSKGLKGSLLPVLSTQEARPLTVEHIVPVGNYAYNISFSDGHDSGLFTFDYLLELGQSVNREASSDVQTRGGA